MTCTIAFRSLHAPCIVVPREQATSMSCDTGCSVWREETLNPISCHPATIRFTSTRYELTTRLLYGDEVCKMPRHTITSRIWLVHWRWEADYRLDGWSSGLCKQSWNYYLASAVGPANFHLVPVLSMAWNALTCAAFKIAQTSLKMTMMLYL